MGGKEYLPVEETENMIYIKDKCLGISEDGEKYIYSVANDDNKENHEQNSTNNPTHIKTSLD